MKILGFFVLGVVISLWIGEVGERRGWSTRKTVSMTFLVVLLVGVPLCLLIELIGWWLKP